MSFRAAAAPTVSMSHAGKFGAQLRAGDNAFPLLSLMGVPWMTIARTDQTVDGAHIVAMVTGTGMRTRRRGQGGGA
jgi:hypothetical protein